MRNKKFATTLVSLLMVSVLAACGGGNNSNNSSASPSDAPSSSAATEPSASASASASEEVEQGTPDMDFDLGGRTIKVVSWWDMAPQERNPDEIAKKQNLAELEKKHNFKMEFVNIDYGEYQEKVTASLLAGEPIGDIVRLGRNYAIPALVQQDLLWPVDEYTKNANAFDQDATYKWGQYNGRGYLFSEARENLAQGIFYNRTLMNQLGIKSLQEYVNEDSWNWDTFIQVAKDANKDTNNDGKLDTWGLANPGLMDQALYSNGAALTVGDKQTLDDPKTVEALNFVSRIATEKVARPTEGGDWTEAGQFYRQGNTLMYTGAMWEIGGLKTDMKDYDIGFVPFPKGPSADTYHSLEGAYQALSIPKAVKDPDKLLYIWEKYNDIDSIYDYQGQAGYEQNLSTEEDINNAKLSAAGLLVLEHFTYPKFPYWELNGDLINGESVSTVIEKYKTPAQAAIDEVYKK
ncbi:ABC transporter substrate-binding protein [Cohnella luojiensis]|uniref:Extracellular solute-binding protein n=1 Tax=Cohnella luojiensis TaxID=652876 RepID=A0A4Y8M1L6_9BACL|nr:extracellular solute-binding protein [Cohnella luojiensis]TFE27501.1 extracellular solute-binding protein [Cohnella luojiensis]